MSTKTKKPTFTYRMKPTFADMMAFAAARIVNNPRKDLFIIILSFAMCILCKYIGAIDTDPFFAIVFITLGNVLLLIPIIYIVLAAFVMAVSVVTYIVKRDVMREEYVLNVYEDGFESVRGELRSEIKFSAINKFKKTGDYLLVKHKFATGFLGLAMLYQMANCDEFLAFIKEKVGEKLVNW